MNTKAQHIVILCHPKPNSFCGAVADEYCRVVAQSGQKAEMRDLYQMRFDPVLRPEEQPGKHGFFQDPHVSYERSIIAGASVIVMIYPIWFGTPPAMLKGYVERVLGSDFTYRAIHDHDAKSLLAGKQLLSFTSSGNSKIWLEEQGQWQSLVQVFDRYLERAFSMAPSKHVHFAPIGADLSERSFQQNMDEVRQNAQIACSGLGVTQG